MSDVASPYYLTTLFYYLLKPNLDNKRMRLIINEFTIFYGIFFFFGLFSIWCQIPSFHDIISCMYSSNVPTYSLAPFRLEFIHCQNMLKKSWPPSGIVDSYNLQQSGKNGLYTSGLMHRCFIDATASPNDNCR